MTREKKEFKRKFQTTYNNKNRGERAYRTYKIQKQEHEQLEEEEFLSHFYSEFTRLVVPHCEQSWMNNL